MGTFNTAVALAAIQERRDQSSVDAIATATAFGRKNLNPDDPQFRMARAAEQEHYLLQQFQYIQNEPESDMKATRVHNMLDRLGELAAEQGDYSRAALLSHTEARRDYYGQVRDAIARDPAEHCDCTDDKILDRKTKSEFTSPAIMPVDTIVTEDGETLSLDRCRKCGFMNAR